LQIKGEAWPGKRNYKPFRLEKRGASARANIREPGDRQADISAGQYIHFTTKT